MYNLFPNDSAEIHIKGLDGEYVDLYITVMSGDSREFRKLKHEAMRDIVKDKAIGVFESAEKAEIKLLASATLSMRGGVIDDLKEAHGSVSPAWLYEKSIIIREQVDQAIASRENFIGP